MEVSEKIKYVRKSLDLNQKGFAAKLKVTQSTISRYEVSESIPDYIFLHKMVSLLNVNPEWLFFNATECFLTEDSLDLSLANTTILKDFQLMSTQEELYADFNEALAVLITKKFGNNNEENSYLYKFLKNLVYEGHLPVRPVPFLYHFFQYIVLDSRKIIPNSKEYITDVIFSYEPLSWNEHPIFSRKMKNEISTKFEEKITEEECQKIIEDAQVILDRIEDTIPESMIRNNKKAGLKRFFPNKF